MTDLAQQTGINDSAKEVAERDARWIGDFADQLTVAIALREWDTAVDLVEQGILFPPLNTCRQPPFLTYILHRSSEAQYDAAPGC
jgi:hypothetical protein